MQVLLHGRHISYDSCLSHMHGLVHCIFPTRLPEQLSIVLPGEVHDWTCAEADGLPNKPAPTESTSNACSPLPSPSACRHRAAKSPFYCIDAHPKGGCEPAGAGVYQSRLAAPFPPNVVCYSHEAPVFFPSSSLDPRGPARRNSLSQQDSIVLNPFAKQPPLPAPPYLSMPSLACCLPRLRSRLVQGPKTKITTPGHQATSVLPLGLLKQESYTLISLFPLLVLPSHKQFL